MIALAKRTRKAVIILITCAIILGACFLVHKFLSSLNPLNNDNRFSSTLPDNFDTEVFSLDSLKASDLQVEQDGRIIGFYLDKNNSLVSAEIQKLLESNNWKQVETSNKSVASYIKQKGKYKWLLMNCTNVCNGTSVVITLDW